MNVHTGLRVKCWSLNAHQEYKTFELVCILLVVVHRMTYLQQNLEITGYEAVALLHIFVVTHKVALVSNCVYVWLPNQRESYVNWFGLLAQIHS